MFGWLGMETPHLKGRWKLVLSVSGERFVIMFGDILKPGLSANSLDTMKVCLTFTQVQVDCLSLAVVGPLLKVLLRTRMLSTAQQMTTYYSTSFFVEEMRMACWSVVMIQTLLPAPRHKMLVFVVCQEVTIL